jgi:hypothetical protein
MICAHIWIYIGMAVCFWRPNLDGLDGKFTIPKMTNLRFKDLQIMGYSDCSLSSCWRRTAKQEKPSYFPKTLSMGVVFWLLYCPSLFLLLYHGLMKQTLPENEGHFLPTGIEPGPRDGPCRYFPGDRIKRTLRPNKKFNWGETCTNMHKHAQTIMICRYANWDCSWRTWNAHDWPRTYPAADP